MMFSKTGSAPFALKQEYQVTFEKGLNETTWESKFRMLWIDL